MTIPATTMLTGPLGSTIHVFRADAGTIAELAAIDWSRHFSRVCLDPVRGIITLMAPSRLHDDLSEILGHVVGAAGSVLTGTARGLRSARLRRRDEPPGTGMEPDCEFYVGERARGYLAALAEGEAEADAYFEHIAPDLVVEVEITHADEGKAGRYGEMGVREMWRLHGRKGTRELRVEFLALRPGSAPRRLAQSSFRPYWSGRSDPARPQIPMMINQSSLSRPGSFGPGRTHRDQETGRYGTSGKQQAGSKPAKWSIVLRLH